MQGLRTLVYRRTVTIAYVVNGDEVAVTDFLYRGEDAPAASAAEHMIGTGH